MIYLDHAATTPIRREALDAYVEASEKYYGNASSLHDIGMQANDVLEKCRTLWGTLIDADPSGIYFTSGGTEANQLTILSYIKAHKERGKHLITTEVEHSSLYNLFQQLAEDGYDVTFLSLQKDGTVSLEEVRKVIRPDTILASIHYGNSEVGILQPIAALGKLFAAHDIFFHVDCVQAFGHVPLSVKKLKIDALSIASHKIYGPKGIGLCYMNPTFFWQSVIQNTTHEKGFRPGTVDVPSIVAFTLAGQLIENERNEQEKKYVTLRKHFLETLAETVESVEVIEHPHAQLPHIIGLIFSHVQGQYVMLECNKRGIALSTGSACQVGKQDPSRTLLSIGKSLDEAKQLVRISLGKATTEKDLVKCVRAFQEIMLEVNYPPRSSQLQSKKLPHKPE